MSQTLTIRTLPPSRPMDWLTAGWHDFLRCPRPGLAHGVADLSKLEGF